MRIIGASFVMTCNQAWDIFYNGGVVIDEEHIIEVGIFEELKKKYCHCDFVFYKNHILLPAFINAHIHFEFSKNDTSFDYGGFGAWLDSVMNNRGEVLKNNVQAIQSAIQTQKKNGVGSVCAISSYDLDLKLLLDSKLKVIYCHEVLGALEQDFEKQAISISTRLEKSLAYKSQSFFPALALHAPYSVNPKIAQYVIDLALKYNLLVSTHFLESQAELEWLTMQSGYFQHFYNTYFQIKNAKPHFTIDNFLSLFHGVRTLFVHCLYADDTLQRQILDAHHIISCPRSNLLLNAKMGNNIIIATDGKSSNIDVSLLNEARYTLFTQLATCKDIDIEILSIKVLQAITCNPARALGLNNGVLEIGKSADVAIFELDYNIANQSIYNEVCSANTQQDSLNLGFHTNIKEKITKLSTCLALKFLLNARQATRLLINGNDIL
ncbi:metal-dependent hydrolase [Helicobacter didelphidarum]|uniref:Metal-dependent hydrolase n=1 Tax=Helicobacter didelphidarum TaxID=2040648 RepID=A0A3D8IG91_9HELI|nr:aminofutalosine deaminase family hydrolase [Helicobacter didelphidarum]RDU64212.1 metal-dependent hydrolase [Helicobacter didelphidarum]